MHFDFDSEPEPFDAFASRTGERPSIRCGRCRRTHTSVAIVRACHAGWEVTPAAEQQNGGGCGWMIPNAYYDFDYVAQVGECGAEIAFGPDAWVCAAGHEHVGMATRHAEGWDYAEDTGDAATLIRAGKAWRPAGAGTDIDEQEAARLAFR